MTQSTEGDVTEEIPVGQSSAAKFAAYTPDRCTLTVLTGSQAGSVFPLEGDELIIGRDDSAHIMVDDPGLSRHHARVFQRGTEFYLEDLGSTNGTFVRSGRIQTPVRLIEGDRILIGRDTVLKFSLQDAFEQEAAHRLYESAVRDPLTQVYNRRYMDERLTGEFAFALRHGSPLSILMLDIDHFKQVNDSHGHLAGDEVLKSLAVTLQKTIRVEDLLARYGGEEFLIVARGADPTNATILAERIRRTVQKVVIPWQNLGLQITLSVGIATRTPDKPYATLEALLSAADGALYAAKEAGRNCVHIA
jgi:two-component system cell cycle response regulator